MDKREEYREGEARCRRLAKNVADPKVREQLIAIADEYAARAAAIDQDGPPVPQPPSPSSH